jgi:hypothetical protein
MTWQNVLLASELQLNAQPYLSWQQWLQRDLYN